MKIEEAIKHCEEVAESCTENQCACREEHLQLKAWLEELVSLRSAMNRKDLQTVDTWHLQEEDDIYESFNDWSYHTFACLMKDGSLQKFSGMLDESYDGSVNKHIDWVSDNQGILWSVDGDGNIEKPLNREFDEYGVDDILFWSELPERKDTK